MTKASRYPQRTGVNSEVQPGMCCRGVQPPQCPLRRGFCPPACRPAPHRKLWRKGGHVGGTTQRPHSVAAPSRETQRQIQYGRRVEPADIAYSSLTHGHMRWLSTSYLCPRLTPHPCEVGQSQASEGGAPSSAICVGPSGGALLPMTASSCSRQVALCDVRCVGGGWAFRHPMSPLRAEPVIFR